MTQHELKILPEYFVVVANGTKTFEVRKDDRLFEVGDILCLREFDGQKYTGREVKAVSLKPPSRLLLPGTNG